MSDLQIENGTKVYKLQDIYELDRNERHVAVDIDTLISRINLAIQSIENQGGQVKSISQIEGSRYVDDGFESGFVVDKAFIALVSK